MSGWFESNRSFWLQRQRLWDWAESFETQSKWKCYKQLMTNPQVLQSFPVTTLPPISSLMTSLPRSAALKCDLSCLISSLFFSYLTSLTVSDCRVQHMYTNIYNKRPPLMRLEFKVSIIRYCSSWLNSSTKYFIKSVHKIVPTRLNKK